LNQFTKSESVFTIYPNRVTFCSFYLFFYWFRNK